MLYVDHNSEYPSNKSHERPIIGFKNNEKIRGISYEIFPFVITMTMTNFNVSRILIDEESSCDIMYAVFFTKLG